MLEDRLRDVLAEDISPIDASLTLISKEQYIPNNIGTRGFVDLLAKDASGRWVLIELKRSNASAREAIHEVLKYVEGVKRHFGVKEEEIRVIIASTEWGELLIPFSRFLSETTCKVEGILLTVENDEKVIGTHVTPLPISDGRVIAPWHELNCYETAESLSLGKASYEKSCRTKKIEDYVLVKMRAPQGFNEAARASLMNSLLAIHGDNLDLDVLAKMADIPSYEYILYFAPRLLSRQQCEQIIQTEKATWAEVSEYIEDMEEEEALGTLHEYMCSMPPRTFRDHFEIGYPAKFRCKLLQDEGWIVEEIFRYGAFERNGLLSDEVILNELSGDDGVTGQMLKKKLRTSNNAELASLRNSVKQCLSQNPTWRHDVLEALDETETIYADAEINFELFNPSTGVMTLFLALTNENGAQYLPSYFLEVVHEAGRCIYYGELLPVDKPASFRTILTKYYDGDLQGVFFPMTWGGSVENDYDVLEELGLVYRSTKFVEIDGEGKAFRKNNGKWKEAKIEPIFRAFASYVRDNQTRITDIVNRIHRHFRPGGMFEVVNVDLVLEKWIDEPTARARNLHFSFTDVERCQLCNALFESEEFLIDGAVQTPPGSPSPWAYMCGMCFVDMDGEIGVGHGQLYRRQDSGDWLMVGGFPSMTEE